MKQSNNICPECYPNPPRFWRDAEMNEEIRKHLTYSRHAKLFYPTLTDALKAWGEETGIEIQNLA